MSNPEAPRNIPSIGQEVPKFTNKATPQTVFFSRAEKVCKASNGEL